MNKNNKDFAWFVTGFTEAEGCFNINIYKTKAGKLTAKLRFSLAIMENDTELLNQIRNFLNCGNISKPRSNGMIHFTVSKLSDINTIIIPHFKNYPLRGNKFQDFNSWCLAANIITEGRHLTSEGIIELQDLFKNMNRSRANTLDYLPSHCNKDSFEYIPINGNYISGFIAGDGSIGIFQHSLTFDSPNFCRIYLSLTQHKNNLFLINEIKSYFKVGIKTKVQTNNTIQLLIENKEIFKSVIIPFFNEFPLYGVKLNNLNKIIKILSLITKYNINRSNPYTPEIKKEIINIWFT
jgi:LAGLIDADG endonuclease